LLLRLSLVLSAGLIGACATDLQRPEAPAINADAAFSTSLAQRPGGAVQTAASWWREAVEDAICDALEDALVANPTLGAAQAEATAARERLRQAEADAGPAIMLTADAQAERASGDTRNSRSLGIDGDLPLDISGALAQRVEAARYAARAADADAVALEFDLARDYLLALIDGAEANQRHALLLRQIEVAGTLLRLIEVRFTQGLASSVDVLQQRDELAALRQQLPQARLDEQLAANRLRVVGARTPDQPIRTSMEALPGVSDRFPAVEPIELLQRRPTLRASRARLEAADARFAAALADRWPTFRLSGGILTRAASGDVTTLIAAALDAALTLFDGGNKIAIAAEQRARLVAAGQQYLADWVVAVIEVDNLLQEEASLRERIVLSEQRLESAQDLLTAARRRYERGVSDYLPVLAALRGLQQQQRDQLALQAGLARSRVRLHRALGERPERNEA